MGCKHSNPRVVDDSVIADNTRSLQQNISNNRSEEIAQDELIPANANQLLQEKNEDGHEDEDDVIMNEILECSHQNPEFMNGLSALLGMKMPISEKDKLSGQSKEIVTKKGFNRPRLPPLSSQSNNSGSPFLSPKITKIHSSDEEKESSIPENEIGESPSESNLRRFPTKELLSKTKARISRRDEANFTIVLNNTATLTKELGRSSTNVCSLLKNINEEGEAPDPKSKIYSSTPKLKNRIFELGEASVKISVLNSRNEGSPKSSKTELDSSSKNKKEGLPVH